MPSPALNSIFFITRQEAIIKNGYVGSHTLMGLYPAGDYKLIFYFYDKKIGGETIFVVNVIFTVTSPLKNW